MTRALVPLLAAILIGPGMASAAGPFELADGDRVVLIGGTMIERDQSFGYLETRLVRRYPDRSIVFRNLGWSGDTVEGISRARFGTTADGFKHLVDHVLAEKPTVVVVGYGANEAFDGAAGLPAFRRNLDTLLDALAPSNARLVFLSPNPQEDLGRPLPDPTAHNADLALYRDALKAEAGDRGAVFVDLLALLPSGPMPEALGGPVLTGNGGRRGHVIFVPSPKGGPNASGHFRSFAETGDGIHLTPYGYWFASGVIERALFGDSNKFVPLPEARGGPGKVAVFANFPTKVEGLETTPSGVRFKLLDETLPGPGLGIWYSFERAIKVANLPPGRYAMRIDGKPFGTGNRLPLISGSPKGESGEAARAPVAAAWQSGVSLDQGPEFDQVEALRAAINAKNQLYFHRWRPENETYLFGFRKHEQGRNAVEIVEFDPLIAAREAEIARLRVPVAHTYELTREGEVGR